jgi:biotin carboxyl carrier protein
VLMDRRSYTVTSLGGGEVSVNGRVFRVEVFDPRSMRGRKAAGVTEGRQAVAAPMPGRVIRVLVEAGQEVEAGQGLIVVEAMKMQNEMKSPKAGRVIEVKAIDGATVAAGDVLVVIE